MARQRTKAIDGYRIQPALPISVGILGAVCVEADFTEYDGETCVEALVRIGQVQNPYTLVHSIHQALEADIIERA